jgi:thiamine-phosphate diphosphorylase
VRELEALANEAMAVLGGLKSEDRSLKTRLLINSRADVALAAGAGGVHLPAGDLRASEVRALVETATRYPVPGTRYFTIAASCHTAEEVAAAAAHGADFAVFGPVFEKQGAVADGLERLRAACRGLGAVAHTEGAHPAAMPVLALGGVTLQNAAECLRAGAAGIAGIRLFQENDIAAVVRQLRGLAAENSCGAAALGRENTLARPARLAYRRRLPHLQKPGRAVFAGFNTLGSLKLDERCRDAVFEHCLHDQGRKLHMHAFVVMPNHVHLLFTPLADPRGNPFSLQEILGSLKGASAHSVNRLLERQGPIWEEEWFDHVIRSDTDFDGKLQYIEFNPVKAHLSRSPSEYRWLWIAKA